MSEAVDFINNLFGGLLDMSLALTVLLLAIVLAIVSMFIWQFYKSTSKRNLIHLDLKKYNRSAHPLTSKIFATILYLLEYIIIMPILIGLWFAALSVVLLLIASDRPVNEILLIAAGMIAAIRILAYFKGEIAKDLAKLFPFIALSIFLLSPGEFDFNIIVDRFKEIPSLMGHIFSFFMVILVLEIVLRAFYSLYEFWSTEEQVSQEKEKQVVVEEE